MCYSLLPSHNKNISSDVNTHVKDFFGIFFNKWVVGGRGFKL